MIGTVWRLVRHGPDETERRSLKGPFALLLYWRTWVCSAVVFGFCQLAMIAVISYGPQIVPLTLSLGVAADRVMDWWMA